MRCLSIVLAFTLVFAANGSVAFAQRPLPEAPRPKTDEHVDIPHPPHGEHQTFETKAPSVCDIETIRPIEGCPQPPKVDLKKLRPAPEDNQ